MSRPILALLLALLCILVVPGSAYALAASECESHGVTYSCYTESVVGHEYEAIYDNGLEGNVNLSDYESPLERWPTHGRRAIEEGVWIGPTFDTRARIYGALNATAQPNATALPRYYDTYGAVVESATSTVRLLSYDVTFNATDIMNGASEFWYMSPLAPEPENWTRHYVEMVEEDGDLMTADTWSWTANGLGGHYNATLGRYVYNLAGVLESGTTYTVNEYVVTNGTPAAGVPFFDVYLAPDQDVAADDETGFRAFPGEQSEVVVPYELAFSFKFVTGLSDGGPMAKYTREANGHGVHSLPLSWMYVEQYDVEAYATTATTDQLRVAIPLETTVPLNVTISLTLTSGATGTVTSKTLSGVTGDISETFLVSSFSNVSARHYYHVRLNVSFDLSQGVPDIVGFKMPASPRTDANGDALAHVVSPHAQSEVLGAGCSAGCPTDRELRAGHFWVKIYEEDVATPAASSWSITSPDARVGAAIFATGLLLLSTGIAAPVGVALVAYGTSVTFRATVNGDRAIVSEDLTRVWQGVVNLADDAAPFVAAAACGGMFFAPGMYRVAAGAVCALSGAASVVGVPALVDFLLQLPTKIREFAEAVGGLLHNLIDFLLHALDEVSEVVLVFWLVFKYMTWWMLAREAILALIYVLRLLGKGERSVARYFVQREATIAAMPCYGWDFVLNRWGKLARGRYTTAPARSSAAVIA